MTSDSADSNSNGQSIKEKIVRLLKRYSEDPKLNKAREILDNPVYTNLESSKQKMIKGVIELSEMNVRDIMIPRVDVVALAHNTKLKEIVKVAGDSGFSRIPVYKENIDTIIGILNIKDLLKLITEKQKAFQLEKILHKPLFVPDTMPLDDLLVEFKKKKLHLAIVVDEYGGITGVITLEDIIEEIVGEIEDEFDEYVPEMQKVNDLVYKVDPRMAISDFNEQTGQDLPTDEFDTIGGFVYDLFGKVPVKNEVVEFEDITFKVSDIRGTRINIIIITIPDEKKDQ